MPIPPPRPAITQRQAIRMLAVPGRRAFAASWPRETVPVTEQVLVGSRFELARNGTVGPPTWLSCEI